MTLDAERFYLPYQFVPVTGKCNNKEVALAAADALKRGACEPGKAGAGARHDLWIDGHRSGRIVCRLTTETPTFVGARRQPDTAPVEVTHATDAPDARDGSGTPLIPGSSLRGMIGSIVETLSQSALRVLEPRTLSVRAQIPNDALSAIGMIARDPDTGDMVLKPLTLPLLNGHSRQNEQVFRLPYNWAHLYGIDKQHEVNIGELLPFYFDGYDQKTNKKSDGIKVKLNSVLNEILSSVPEFKNNDIYSLVSGVIPEPWATVDKGRHPGEDLSITLSHNVEYAYVKPSKNGVYLLGSKPCDKTSEVELEASDNTDDADGFYGQLRILDVRHAMESVPGTKYHERFVPLTTTAVRTINFDEGVIADFNRICDDRYSESKEKFPFVPLGGASAAERARGGGWLREGDLVFFNIDDALRVTRVAFSSIWRRPVPGNIEGAFNELGRRGDSRPAALSSYRDNRQYLSPAETLLGVVRESKKSKARNEPNDPLPALASRLRFHDAHLTSGAPKVAATPITLQILSSPKPPSPAFYFQGGVPKQQLDLTKHKPNGRKFYLHHPKPQIDAAMYVSHHDEPGLRDQKARIRPLLKDNAFEFHIDFENLSDAELHLLLTSMRPARDFRHRIGMGKPLGMGTVRVDVLGLFEVDRYARYGTDGLDAPRYAKAWVAAQPDLRIGDTQRYAMEAEATKAAASREELSQGGYDALLGSSHSLVDTTSLNVLCKIGAWEDGRPLALEPNVAVCYPRTADQLKAFVSGQASRDRTVATVAEAELFKWNVENDDPKNQSQHLTPVPQMDKPMQPLSAQSSGRTGESKGDRGRRPQSGKPQANTRPGAARRL